jgi:serine-type D-Ala-D-Ala carboxypeptidase (penicillin-binding protein 5/6)
MIRRLLFAVGLAVPLVSFAAQPVPPELAARAYAFYDVQSGQTLAGKNADAHIEPASLTKLMTAYLSFKAVKEGRLRLDQTLPVSSKAWKTEGSRMFLDVRVPVRVEDLLRGMIVQSGNDACVVLAEAIAGSEGVFAGMMNTQAQKMGLTNTHFTNSTGLPDPQLYTSANDLSRLSAAIIHDFPEFFPIYSIQSFTYNKITQANRNPLLGHDPDVDGMKTGHTESAGFNLVATSKKGGRRVIAVVIGTTSMGDRGREAGILLDWGLNAYETPKLYAAKQAVTKAAVYKGSASEVTVGFLSDHYVSVPRGRATDIKQNFTVNKPLVAPLKVGQTVGTMQLMLDGEKLAEYPLVAIDSVEQGSWWRRFIDTIRLWFA